MRRGCVVFTYNPVFSSQCCCYTVHKGWFGWHRGLGRFPYIFDSCVCDYKSGCTSLLQVIGIVTAGFGLSSTVFSPLQTLLINPSNLPPLKAGNKIGNIGKLWTIPGRWPVQLHFTLLQTGGGAQPSVLPSSMFSRFWPTFPPPFST